MSKKVPVVLQEEAAECGLACLAMVLGAVGHSFSLHQLRKLHGSAARGLTLDHLALTAAAHGLVTRPLRVELEELVDVRTPAILHWAFTHFVVLVKATPTHVVIHDPASGRKKVSLKEASQAFTGVVLELTPAENFSDLEPPKRLPLFTRMWRSPGLLREITKLGVAAIAVELLTLTTPLFQQWVVDRVISGGDVDLLTTLAIGFSVLALLKGCIAVAKDWATTRLSHEAHEKWQIGIFSHLLRLPAEFFGSRTLSEILTKFESAKVASRTVTHVVCSAISDCSLTLLTLGFMILYSPMLTLVVIAGVALQVSVQWFMGATQAETEQARTRGEARDQAHLIETFRGIRTIKAFNREEDRQQYWVGLASEVAREKLKGERLQLNIEAVKSTVLALEYVAIFYFGAKLVLSQQMTVGALFAFSMYRSQFNVKAMRVLENLLKLRYLRVHADRLAEIAHEPVEEGFTNDRSRPAGVFPSIEFRNVSFRHGMDDPWLLRNCSFSIHPGEHVAITGKSGCGKSTILKLLLGYHQPVEGDIYIGGVSLRRHGIRRARACCATVMQDDVLFGGTIGENISLYATEAGQHKIEASARLAEIHASVRAMPMGYDTRVGDMGAALSGGEKQRILLARAFYHEADILLLDEATSHLDGKLEAAIVHSIKKMKKTCLSIAHRTQTIHAADRILALHDGTLREVSRSQLQAEPALQL